MKTGILATIIGASIISQSVAFGHSNCCKSEAVQTVTLIVKCDAKAKVIINGRTTKSRGKVRHYTVRFAPGDYTIRIDQNGESGFARFTIGFRKSPQVIDWKDTEPEEVFSPEEVGNRTQKEHEDSPKSCPTCQSKPQCATCQAKPACKTCPPKSACKTCPPKPECKTCRPKPACKTCPPKPACKTCPPKSECKTCPAKPECKTCPPKVASTKREPGVLCLT